MSQTIYAVSHKYIQNLDEVYEAGAEAVYDTPELAYTCECTDLNEVLAFNRFLEGEQCEPGLDLVVEPVSYKAPTHYNREQVKSQLMRTFATLADISGVENARFYGQTDLVASALSDD